MLRRVLNRALVASAAVTVVLFVVLFAVIFVVGVREGLFPWTDHVGTDWTTVHVRNETDAEVRFGYVFLGGERGAEGCDAARYVVAPRAHRSFELPFVTGSRLGRGSDGRPRAAWELMLCRRDEAPLIVPVELAEGDHYRLRVDAWGAVHGARTRATWLGPVSFWGAGELELAEPLAETR